MELFRALGVLCEPPGPEHERIGVALELPGGADAGAYADLFLFQLYPYASVYLGPEGMLGGEARDRVAGFWRALGLAPPAEPDHLAALLGLYASLVEAEGAEPEEARRLLRRESRAALLWEHLLSWVPPYLAKLDEIAPPFYRVWGAVLRAALRAEAEELLPGLSGSRGAGAAHRTQSRRPSRTRSVVGAQPRLPLALREAPRLEGPEHAGAQAFLEGLLAPVRSGMVLVRDDLARAAGELGLGLRLAERRFVLRSLLEQDAAGTLAWLAQEAEAWSARHADDAELAGEAARFWQARAEAAAALLAEASDAARRHGLAPTPREPPLLC